MNPVICHLCSSERKWLWLRTTYKFRPFPQAGWGRGVANPREPEEGEC